MQTRSTIVYVYLDGEPVPAGRLEMIEDGRHSYATFQYDRRYLRRSDRVAVDPVALPLPDAAAPLRTFRTAEHFELFNGIRDAAPDGWGRCLMHKAAGATSLTEYNYLVASGGYRVGALAFGPDATGGPKRLTPWREGDTIGEPLDLDALAEAADRVQSVDRFDSKLWRFLEAGSSLGGARPKAAVDHRGMPWIAKFSAKGDTYPVCHTELAVMRLAKECGLDVPETDFASILGRDIYLIQRFDRATVGTKLLRRPFASALTILGRRSWQRTAIATATSPRSCDASAQSRGAIYASCSCA